MQHNQSKDVQNVPCEDVLKNVRFAMDEIQSSSIRGVKSDECPNWFERLMTRDAATLRQAVIVGCAVFWGIVFLLIFS